MSEVEQGAATPRTCKLAVASFAVAILSVFTCPFYGGVVAIVGLALGIAGLWQISRSSRGLTGGGFAIAGIGISAVAALLAFGVYPILSGAKEAARKSTCLNNMKQCAQALKLYCDDYDNTLPSSVLVNGKAGDPKDYQTFGCTLCPGKDFPGDGKIVRSVTWPQVLYDSMRDRDCMWCPDDCTDRTAAKPLVSYWLKYAMDKAWAPPLNRRTITDYGYESQQIAFFEHAGWHYRDDWRTNGLAQGVEINVSFMDSHVEKIALPASAPTGYINNPSGATGPYEPFFYNCYVSPKSGKESNYIDRNPLPVSARTGVCIDPADNYDKW